MTEREKRELERDYNEMMERDKKFYDESLILLGKSKGQIAVAKRLKEEKNNAFQRLNESNTTISTITTVMLTLDLAIDIINEMLTSDYDREFEELKEKYGRN